MTTTGLPIDAELAELRDRMVALRADVVTKAHVHLERFGVGEENATPELRNLAAYLAIRQHDLRPLQRDLMRRGYSSLGRLESRVIPTLDAVISNLSVISGQDTGISAPSEQVFFAGEAALQKATNALFGPPPGHRRARIMVTMPSTAAGDAELVRACARAGMDVARINCAHDDAATWRAMVANIHAAAEDVGRHVGVFMDVAGPKIRTGAVKTPVGKAKLQMGEALRLMAVDEPWIDERARFSAQVSLPEMVTRLSPGDRIRYDDGKLEGVVESVEGGEAIVRVTHTKTGGTKLKPEKGLNLPDTELGLSPLTAKDESDLATVVACADMIGYSFVSRAEDIDLLEEMLGRHERRGAPLGVVAKIELPEAVRNLPALIARVGGRRPFGVMIARGDLAAELGFDRVAEMQEELLWICEAASVPAIWATQVLEDLMKTGLPSRGEMTDAAMAARAECVMLNKGPAVVETIGMLDGLLARMDAHMFKKTPQLRALKSW